MGLLLRPAGYQPWVRLASSPTSPAHKSSQQSQLEHCSESASVHVCGYYSKFEIINLTANSQWYFNVKQFVMWLWIAHKKEPAHQP